MPSAEFVGAEALTVRVLLFASHREAVGMSSREIELPDRATVDDLFEVMASQHRSLCQLRRFTTFAVNREVVDPSIVLRHGDEVAFLQPVSGGAQ